MPGGRGPAGHVRSRCPVSRHQLPVAGPPIRGDRAAFVQRDRHGALPPRAPRRRGPVRGRGGVGRGLRTPRTGLTPKPDQDPGGRSRMDGLRYQVRRSDRGCTGMRLSGAGTRFSGAWAALGFPSALRCWGGSFHQGITNSTTAWSSGRWSASTSRIGIRCGPGARPLTVTGSPLASSQRQGASSTATWRGRRAATRRGPPGRTPARSAGSRSGTGRRPDRGTAARPRVRRRSAAPEAGPRAARPGPARATPWRSEPLQRLRTEPLPLQSRPWVHASWVLPVPGLRSGRAWAGRIRDRPAQTRLSARSMLPCVALEYGKVWCAASTRARAVSGSTPGRLTLRRACRR
jgi:hypothetical protein